MPRRGSVEDIELFCSNFFFISFTLARAALWRPLPWPEPGPAVVVVGVPVTDRILVPSVPENLSSTGLEAERYIDLVPVRLPGAEGGFVEDALLFDRDAGG